MHALLQQTKLAADLYLLNDTSANAHSDPKTPKQHLRRCQVDCTLSTVHSLGRCPDAGPVVPISSVGQGAVSRAC